MDLACQQHARDAKQIPEISPPTPSTSTNRSPFDHSRTIPPRSPRPRNLTPATYRRPPSCPAGPGAVALARTAQQEPYVLLPQSSSISFMPTAQWSKLGARSTSRGRCSAVTGRVLCRRPRSTWSRRRDADFDIKERGIRALDKRFATTLGLSLVRGEGVHDMRVEDVHLNVINDIDCPFPIGNSFLWRPPSCPVRCPGYHSRGRKSRSCNKQSIHQHMQRNNSPCTSH